MAKKPAKYYEYKIEWVQITPEIKVKIFPKELAWRQYQELGRSCNYSAEYFRLLFKSPPEKLNKVVYDAIVNYLGLNLDIPNTTTPVYDKPVVWKSPEKTKITLTDLSKPTVVKSISDPPPKTNYPINTMPVRKKGEDAFDFASRKNEWKRKQK